MRSEYILPEILYCVIDELTYANGLAMLAALKTGLRIDDVLSLKRGELRLRMTVREKKTGKSKRVYFGVELYKALKGFALQSPLNSTFVFPNRCNAKKHRTRQAVYKDVKKAVEKLRLTGQISPHSARKCAAVREFKRTGSLESVKNFLNHDRELTTLIYALSDTALIDSLYKKHS